MSEHEDFVVTLVDDDGNEKDFLVADFIEVDGKKYAIVIDAEECECEKEECVEEEAYIFRVEVGEDGEEELVDIENDEEYEKVIEALDELDDFEDFDDEDLDDEDEE